MKKTQPEAFTLDRIASPLGEVLLVTDAEGAVRAEQWRPWRAYGALHLREAGIDGAALMEMDDEKDAA